MFELRCAEQPVNDAESKNVRSLRFPSDDYGVCLLVGFLDNDVLHQSLRGYRVWIKGEGVLGRSDDEVAGPAGQLTVRRLSLQ